MTSLDSVYLPTNVLDITHYLFMNWQPNKWIHKTFLALLSSCLIDTDPKMCSLPATDSSSSHTKQLSQTLLLLLFTQCKQFQL
mmetsp:Transcript_13670/g.29645  ORF Transcript_13670/g.29645 Transcript_13670/m.29645 type:complete len:83 (+) Transcript_13670:61-309(+)